MGKRKNKVIAIKICVGEEALSAIKPLFLVDIVMGNCLVQVVYVDFLQDSYLVQKGAEQHAMEKCFSHKIKFRINKI